MSDLHQEDKVLNLNIEAIAEKPAAEAFDYFKVDMKGLTSLQITEAANRYGKNVIREQKGTPLIIIFLKNFISLMAILLWIGGIVAIIAGMPQLGIAIWLVNIINGIFSFWQEFRASKATEALKKMLPSYARVIRNGTEDKILTEDLVPGDILLIEEGDKISADARLFQTNDLKMDQSTLTGESKAVHKASDVVVRGHLTRFEFSNVIFTGTTVASGTGRGIVISTGMNTEFGKIANLTREMKHVKSPLQNELDRLTRQISIISLGIGLAFFLAAVFFVKDPVAPSFIFALGMVVAFIPEGLLPTVTLSLAGAVQRMAKKNALVKTLSSVETLGSTTVICSDKTGTLTENQMTINHLWLIEQELNVTGLGYEPEGEILKGNQSIVATENKDVALLLTASGLCNNARVVPPHEEILRYTVLGDPTEACIHVAAQKAKIDLEVEGGKTPRLSELPFDSSRKRMTTIHQWEDQDKIAYTKGAPKEVLELANSICIDGKARPITQAQRDKIMAANDSYARLGLRVLAVAYRVLDQEKQQKLPRSVKEYTIEQVETDLTFIGLLAMSDPARPEVKEAVEKCRRASIRIVMITGDYGLTAESIARQIGIVVEDHPRIVTGSELEGLDDVALKKILEEEVIFARVAPEQKYRVVSNLQEMGHVVAATGDGVNDAPALKKADIGVAMGISGTDVAKEVADMILTDDNFASIVKAVEEGRAVYSNIQKFLLYILNGNMAEAVPSAAFLLSKGLITLPLTIMQMLSIDLGTDMLPALGLGVEKPEEGIMDHPPRSRNSPLLNKKIIIKGFFWYGMLTSAVSMGAYFFVNFKNGWPNVALASEGAVYTKATTMVLASIIFCQIGAVMNCRTEKESVFKLGLFSNKRILVGVVVEILILIILAYTPFLQGIFNTAPLNLADWIFLICIPIPFFLIEELRKYFVRKRVS